MRLTIAVVKTTSADFHDTNLFMRAFCILKHDIAAISRGVHNDNLLERFAGGRPSASALSSIQAAFLRTQRLA